MKADEFKRWQEACGLTGVAAARLLGVHPNTVGRFRSEGGPEMLRLACLAIYHRLHEPLRD